MNLKLVIIVLSGVIAGMLLSVPTVFMSDVLVGGLVVGFLAGVVGHFATRRKSLSHEE